MQHIVRPTAGSTILTPLTSTTGRIIYVQPAVKIKIKSENVPGDSGALVGAFGYSSKSTSVLLTPVFGFLSSVGCMACSVPYLPETSQILVVRTGGVLFLDVTISAITIPSGASRCGGGKVYSGEGERFGVVKRLWGLPQALDFRRV